MRTNVQAVVWGPPCMCCCEQACIVASLSGRFVLVHARIGDFEKARARVRDVLRKRARARAEEVMAPL